MSIRWPRGPRPSAPVGVRLGVALCVGLLSGCASIGPQKLLPSHEGYNDAVQLTLTREILKNIVRERYFDPGQYISVASINAQFSVSTTGTVGVGDIGQGARGEGGMSVRYGDSPTITFVPLGGAGFYNSLESHFSLAEALSVLYRVGHMQDFELELMLSSINFDRDRVGPTGDGYREKLAALARLLRDGASFRYFREFRPSHFVALSKDKLTAGDLSAASKAGLHFAEVDDEQVELGTVVVTTGLEVPLPHEGQVAADLALLGLEPGSDLYPVRPPTASRPEAVGIQSNTLWLEPRTASGLLDLGVFCVDVPEEHRTQGLAPAEDALPNTGVRLPLRIQHAVDEPGATYRIRHRGYWFFVDDSDLVSKWIFRVMVIGFQSRIGAIAAEDRPSISLPIGGF